jgi:hypothetical protein
MGRNTHISGSFEGDCFILGQLWVVKINMKEGVWVFSFSLYNFLGHNCGKGNGFHVLL